MKRLLVVIALVVTVLSAGLPPAAANRNRPASVVDVLVRTSSANGPDSRSWDFDLLIAVASNVEVPAGQPGAGQSVAAVLSGVSDITLWAPNDRAFTNLAGVLGCTTCSTEAATATFLADAVNSGGLNDTVYSVLTYHVTPGNYGALRVLFTREFPTLNGATIVRSGLTLQDQDPDIADPQLTLPLQLTTSNNSVVHAINGVLLPVNL